MSLISTNSIRKQLFPKYLSLWEQFANDGIKLGYNLREFQYPGDISFHSSVGETSNEGRAERGARVAKGIDLHAAHSCTWLLLDRRTGPTRARCQMIEAICSGVYLLPGAWKENPFLPVRGSQKAEGERPEDYIRFPRKRNIERNLIMLAGCAHVARFRSVCGHDFYSSSAENAGASGKRFSDMYGK